MPAMANAPAPILMYNGESFGALSETTAFSVKPVKTSDGRSVAYHQFNLSFRTYVTGPYAAVTSNRLRAALGKNGGPFIYGTRASGNIEVNVGRVRDVKNGPFVTELGFRLVGATRTTELTWSIEFCIPECADAQYRNAPMDYSYSVSVAVDKYGYSSRTISGKLRIPQNRVAPGVPFSQDSADKYVEEIVPDPAPGYHRTYGPRTLSEDRSEVSFSVTDTQLMGPAPPPGIVEHDATVSMTSEDAVGATWSGSIDYWADLAIDGSIDIAKQTFFKFVSERFDAMSQMTTASGSRSQVVPSGYSTREPTVFRGPKRFEGSVRFLVASTLEEMLMRSGMWTRVKSVGGSWFEWSRSLLDSAFHPRGKAKIVFDVGEDRITDLCNPALRVAELRAYGNDAELRAQFLAPPCPPPNPDTSWIFYRNELSLEQESGVAELRTLPVKKLDEKTDRGGETYDGELVAVGRVGPNGEPAGGGIQFPRQNGGIGGVGNRIIGNVSEALTRDAGGTTAERVRRPSQVIVMTGCAARVGYPIPEPKLVYVNNTKVVRSDTKNRPGAFQHRLEGQAGCHPVYYAQWKIRYCPETDLPDIPLPIFFGPMDPPPPQFVGYGG